MGKIDFSTPEWEYRINVANRTDLVAYCEKYGIPLVHCGSEWRHKDYDSMKIRGNRWCRHSGKTGLAGRWSQGYAVAFAMEYSGVNFFEALKRLLEISDPGLLPLPMQKVSAATPKKYESLDKRIARVQEQQKSGIEKTEKVPFVRPDRNCTWDKAFVYLTEQRGLDEEVLQEMYDRDLLYEDVRHNCVFIRKDSNRNPVYAALKGTYKRPDGTYFEGEVGGSDKRWAWAYTPAADAKVLFVFESPIDLLSYITLRKAEALDWKTAHYLSLGGLSEMALENYVQLYPTIKAIAFGMDNDDKGCAAIQKFTAKYSKRYNCKTMQPPKAYKDWNDLLVDMKRQRIKQSEETE